MAKKISFKKLHELVANVDYCFDGSFPIVFNVVQKGDEYVDGELYLVGLTNEIHLDSGEIVTDTVSQFVMELSHNRVLDLQDEELMEFEAIGKMLKEKCAIEKGATIYLEEDESFNGDEYYVKEKQCIDKTWFNEYNEYLETKMN